jgi:protein TonB
VRTLRRCGAGAASAPGAAAAPPADPANAPPRLVSGVITNDDYPAAALRAEAQGTTAVRIDIGTDGRVTGCSVTASSGNSTLDSTTCSLIQRRFRYAPATRNGRPAAGSATQRVRWVLPDV